MLLKQVFAVLLFLPAIAIAECGFIGDSKEMTIVVSKQSNNRCFQSEQFREAFRANLVAAVKTMDERAPVKTAERRASPRPPGMPIPIQQAELYYGQAPKR
ncbi:hypothetical protein [Noviherbaspirillum sp.]|uniref:hypothetical protein n=1 Tax=Noviherbaspirillum sp. TaxID=1926288 RepID=UPI002D419E74|nr:hypothetical protein [Noviherbaspirillum sp.]HZW22095.1 hypothetical protein [Noviherbaspirillum sp.]